MSGVTRLVVGGDELEVARLDGAADAPTLVLLHEGLGCVAMWKDFPRALAERTGCPVLAFSRTGYGASTPVALPRPLDFHTREALDALPALLDGAAIGECILVGHSDGASIALIHAGAVGDPRVRALAVMAPHVFTEAKCVAAIRAARERFEHGDLRARLARYHGDNVDCAFHGWADTWLDPGFATWSIEQHLGAITVPVLCIRGEDDPYNTPRHVERIVARVAGPVSRRDLPGCGHAPHAEARGAVLDALGRFVGAVRAGPAGAPRRPRWRARGQGVE